jgi:DNA mismatch repair protein MutL
MKLFPRLVTEVTPERYGDRVHVLPPDVAYRIAAGEVIECPASAVKELVENALDAGASRVEVGIEGGGVALIRVRDDGSGMSPGDAERAVGRHATSKISSAEDLVKVASLGFRGEALHAISSVSALTLTTREAGADHATRIRVLAGSFPECSSAAHPVGTKVEVRDLFMNLSVRRGFLGTQRAETNAVSTVVESLALSRPHVGFFLRVDGRGFLALPAAADLRERVAQVHGLTLARSLVTLDEAGGPVWGLVSPLSVSFPTRRYLHVAVNGRVVDTDSFAPAVAKAYADLLPKGRHPAAFLRLELGPGEVDVNVHPAKSAVRLKGGRSVYPLVVGAIRGALAPEREEGGTAPSAQDDNELRPIGQFAGRCILA